MNEFEGKSKADLKVIRIGLESYMQGVKDTVNLINDLQFKTLQMFEKKLEQCEAELEKVQE